MAAKSNPEQELQEQAAYISELESRLDRISGLTEVTDEIDSEEGLRASLDRVADLAALDADDFDGEDENFDGEDENFEDEGFDEE
jgi:hypothetical protein